jgi:aminopeptidase N
MRCIFLFLSILTFSQQTKSVDFISCDALLFPDAKTKSISGTVHYLFEIKNNIDSVKIDAKNMIFSAIYINDNTKLKYKLTNDHIILYDGLKKGFNGITIKYEAKPKQTLYFTGKGEHMQIWTQGQGRYTSHWLPSFDDVNEKVIFKISVYFDNKFHVLSNGNLAKKVASVKLGEMKTLWEYEMQKPMSSYLVMLAIGNFEKQTATTKSGTPLEFYLEKKDFLKFKPTYRYSVEMFDYLEQEIGVKYP